MLKIFENLKEKIKEKDIQFKSKSKRHQQAIIKKKIFGSLSLMTFWGLFILSLGFLFFLNPNIPNKLLLKENKIEETAPSILVQDFYNFKGNTIFKREDILKYQVSKEKFYKEMLNKNENEALKRELSEEEIKEYLEYEEEKLNENLSLIKEGLFFVVENDNYKELIATDKNGFISYYNKDIRKVSEKKQKKYFEKFEEFNKLMKEEPKNSRFTDSEYLAFKELKYKNLKIEKVKIKNKDTMSVGLNNEEVNSFNSLKEFRDNYFISKFTEKEIQFSLFKLMNSLQYKIEDKKLINIFYYNVNIDDSFNGFNKYKKEIKESLEKASMELNDKIDDYIFMIFIHFLFLSFFLYGYRKEKKVLKEFEIEEEKVLLENEIDKEIKNKVEIIKV